MTNYATKTKDIMTKSIALMIRKILYQAKYDSLNMQTVLTRSISKLLGEHMISK